METPYQDNIDPEDFNYVYEPAEDSFLVIDSLEQEIPFLTSIKPSIFVEIGSGSGVIITAFAKTFPSCFCLSTDINYKANTMTLKTAKRNQAVVDSVSMDLCSFLVDGKIDVLVFNPPYVVTCEEECGSRDLSAAWAGGVDGRQVINKFLDAIPKKMSQNGVIYLLLIKENKPDEVVDIMLGHGFKWETVLERQVRNEHQMVLKFYR